MLITTCTHCLARFRVTPQQLNLKQGQVRCGHCQKIFSGFEALERFPDDDTGSRILAARAAAATPPAPAPASAPSSSAPPTLSAASQEPIRSAPFDSIPLDQLPEIDPTEPERPEVTLEDKLRPASREVDPGPSSDALPETEPAAHAARSPLRASSINLIALPEPEAPPPIARSWIFGCVFLGLLLAMQITYSMRAKVAQSYPVTRPWLESVCAKAGCTVPWVNDPQLLKLEDSELLEVPGKPTEIALGARIRNLAQTAQEFPHLELTLTDLTGQAAARRVLRPADYLGRAPVTGEVMAAGSEIAIQMRLETPRIKATGYELLLFYP
jgi:predicted Zn finger-like uncharacterized protein